MNTTDGSDARRSVEQGKRRFPDETLKEVFKLQILGEYSQLPNETLVIIFEILHEDAITVSHIN
jgi:hypothetical protein